MKSIGVLKHLFHVCLGAVAAVLVFVMIKFVLIDFTVSKNSKDYIPATSKIKNVTDQFIEVENDKTSSDDVYSLVNHSNAFDKDCNEKFNYTLQGNLKIIANYPGGQAESFMWKIGGNFSKPIQIRKNPVLVTAVSKKYFPLLMKLVHSFHLAVVNYRQKDERIKVIIYDIGLTRGQIKTLKGMPCTIREFPFDEFPPHVRTSKYRAWKPIIIQMLLVEFGFVWWVDTATRFKTLNVDKAFTEVKKFGLVYKVKQNNSLTRRTSTDTFKYLGEDTCKFKTFPEADSSSVLAYFNPISNVIVRAWAKCALEKKCIAPDDSRVASHLKCNTDDRYIGTCHNFDQSVFSILTRRIFHDEIVYAFNKVSEEIVKYNRSDILDLTKCKHNVCYI